ncbi:hypothetical protein QOT17_005707 [Balamuthia mandrillaris]
MSRAAGWRQTLGGGALMGSLLVAAMELGGGIYEHVVVCRAWPNLAVFQPQHGGVDRKRFWIPMHVALSALLPVATWAVWPHRESRRLILIADGIYAALRVRTFAYFVPEVMRIEAAPQMTEELEAAGRRWEQLSLLRVPLHAATLAALWWAWRAATAAKFVP